MSRYEIGKRKLLRDTRRAAGKCIRCNRASTKPYVLCVKCRMRSSSARMVQVKAWVAGGACRMCGGKTLNKRSKCKRCIDRLIERRKRTKIVVRDLILVAKSVPCTDCGTTLPPQIMHLDHVRGVKKWGFGKNSRSRTISSVKTELKKCQVRCPNCHALRHHKERNARTRKRNTGIRTGR